MHLHYYCYVYYLEKGVDFISLPLTANIDLSIYAVSVRRGFLFLLVLEMDCVI